MKIKYSIRLLIVINTLLILSCGPAPDAPSEPPPSTGEVILLESGIFAPSVAFRNPMGISFGIDGSLYVCDRGRSSIVRIDTTGALIARYSNFTNRTERLYAPLDVNAKSGIHIYAIDVSDSRVIRLDRGLRNGYTVFDGEEENSELFGSFGGLTYDTAAGDIYITDRDKGSIVRIDMLSDRVQTLGKFGSAKLTLSNPLGIDVDADGALYIADSGRADIVYMENFGSNSLSLGKDALEAPADVTVFNDSLLAVADKHGVVILSKSNKTLGTAGFNKRRAVSPQGIAVRNKHLYVTDGASSVIRMYEIKIKPPSQDK